MGICRERPACRGVASLIPGGEYLLCFPGIAPPFVGAIPFGSTCKLVAITLCVVSHGFQSLPYENFAFRGLRLLSSARSLLGVPAMKRSALRAFFIFIRKPLSRLRFPSENKKPRLSAGRFCFIAEREGFEPSVRISEQRFSRPPHSATLASLRNLPQRYQLKSIFRTYFIPNKRVKTGLNVLRKGLSKK